MRILPVLLLPVLFAQSAWDVRFQSGEALERQGKYAASVAEFEAALSAAELLGPDDWKLPLTLHNLGVVNRELGRDAGTERYYQRAISIWEKHHPDRAPDLAASLQNLAALRLVQGRLSAAESLYRRAIALQPGSSAGLHGLARLLQERRQYREADDLYRRAAAILEREFGPSALEVADISHNWATLYRDMHRDSEARPLLERAAAIYDRAAPGHPKLAIILRNLAELEASQGHLALADQLFVRSLRICEVSLPADHSQTGIILGAYGKFLYHARRKDEAKAVTTRAQSIMAKNAGYTVDVSALRR